MRLSSTPVLLWGLEGRQKSVACLTLRPPGEGPMTALALWERFPRAVLGYLSGEMLNISQGFSFVFTSETGGHIYGLDLDVLSVVGLL